VYIDETGSESLSDPAYPVFGLGGCAIEGSRFYEAIEKPWKDLKARHFGGAAKPLHASEIDLANTAGVQALGRFFAEQQFMRFATVFGSSTVVKPSPSHRYHAVAAIIGQQLGEIVKASSFYRFVLLFEASQRGNLLAMHYFTDFQPLLAGPNGPFRA